MPFLYPMSGAKYTTSSSKHTSSLSSQALRHWHPVTDFLYQNDYAWIPKPVRCEARFYQRWRRGGQCQRCIVHLALTDTYLVVGHSMSENLHGDVCVEDLRVTRAFFLKALSLKLYPNINRLKVQLSEVEVVTYDLVDTPALFKQWHSEISNLAHKRHVTLVECIEEPYTPSERSLSLLPGAARTVPSILKASHSAGRVSHVSSASRSLTKTSSIKKPPPGRPGSTTSASWPSSTMTEEEHTVSLSSSLGSRSQSLSLATRTTSSHHLGGVNKWEREQIEALEDPAFSRAAVLRYYFAQANSSDIIFQHLFQCRRASLYRRQHASLHPALATLNTQGEELFPGQVFGQRAFWEKERGVSGSAAHTAMVSADGTSIQKWLTSSVRDAEHVTPSGRKVTSHFRRESLRVFRHPIDLCLCTTCVFTSPNLLLTPTAAILKRSVSDTDMDRVEDVGQNYCRQWRNVLALTEFLPHSVCVQRSKSLPSVLVGAPQLITETQHWKVQEMCRNVFKEPEMFLSEQTEVLSHQVPLTTLSFVSLTYPANPILLITLTDWHQSSQPHTGVRSVSRPKFPSVGSRRSSAIASLLKLRGSHMFTLKRSLTKRAQKELGRKQEGVRSVGTMWRCSHWSQVLSEEIKANALCLSSFSYQDVGKQLTKVHTDMFINLTYSELVDCVWMRGDKLVHSRYTVAIIDFYERVVKMILHDILLESQLERRADVIMFYIKLGDWCLFNQNYHALCVIFMALQHPAIYRLRHTWQFIAQEYSSLHSRYVNLSDLMADYTTDKAPQCNYHKPYLKFFANLLFYCLELECAKEVGLSRETVSSYVHRTKLIYRRLLKEQTAALRYVMSEHEDLRYVLFTGDTCTEEEAFFRSCRTEPSVDHVCLQPGYSFIELLLGYPGEGEQLHV